MAVAQQDRLERVAKALMPAWSRALLRVLRLPGDRRAMAEFLRRRELTMTLGDRLRLLARVSRISSHVPCLHTEEEMLEALTAILLFPRDRPGVIVEAGCYKGGSAAKLSLGARLAGRPLHLFDSFAGIPDNRELTDDGEPYFPPGSWAGGEEEVRENLARHGEVLACVIHHGLFEETMQDFDEPVAVAYLDVDLAASTRTCLKHLYPRLVPGGTLFSQDAHLPLVRAVLSDAAFWEGDVGCQKPEVVGLGTRKLVHIVKPKAGF
jgi:O-methyltransferase